MVYVRVWFIKKIGLFLGDGEFSCTFEDNTVVFNTYIFAQILIYRRAVQVCEINLWLPF